MSFINLNEIIEKTDNIFAHINNDKKISETLDEHIYLCQKYYEKIYESKKLEQIIEKIKNSLFEQELNEILKQENGNYEILNKNLQQFFTKAFKNVITFHDVGKLNPKFQKSKMKNMEYKNFTIEGINSSNHSNLSSYIYIDYFIKKLKNLNFPKNIYNKLKLMIIINAYVISRHHSDLSIVINDIADFEQLTQQVIKELLNMEKNIINFKYDSFYLERENLDNYKDLFDGLLKNSKKGLKNNQKIHLYIYIKLLYSILVSCDYYATTEFMNDLKTDNLLPPQDFKLLAEIYNQTSLVRNIRNHPYPLEEKEFSNSKDINILRNEIFCEADKSIRQNLDKDIFFLKAPTGIGKSNIAMNLSFNFLKKEMQKIVYVYPFNTLVEQNLSTIKKTFDNDEKIMSMVSVVNSITPIAEKISEDFSKKEESDYYNKALLDRQFYHYPFVLTTHVSFFEKLFSAKKENIFSLYQLANSVIVLDEIQSYKIDIWTEFMIFLKEFASILNIKVIIMSATLHQLDFLVRKNEYEQNYDVVNLIKNPEKYFLHPLFKDRVKINYDLIKDGKIEKIELLEHIKKNTINGKKILIEFIMKKNAYEFYNMVKKEFENDEIYLITGDDNIYERKNIIEKINSFDKKDKKLILVATQVIEAGVDIDMDVGYKSISKLDSEEQFLGRINRSAKKEGIAYFFYMEDAKRIYKNDIRINDFMILKQQEIKEILIKKEFDIYYKKIMEILFDIKNSKCNDEGLGDLFERKLYEFDFRSIENKMKLIQDTNYFKTKVFFNTAITIDSKTLIGRDVWQEYKALLKNNEMDYARKKVEMSIINSKLNYFLYEINFKFEEYSDFIGDIIYIEDAEKYFENGKLNIKPNEENLFL